MSSDDLVWDDDIKKYVRRVPKDSTYIEKALRNIRPRKPYQGSLACEDPEPAVSRLMAERDELRAALRDVVNAMILWGSWEDGVPEDCSVGQAFDRACQVLGLEVKDGKLVQS